MATSSASHGPGAQWRPSTPKVSSLPPLERLAPLLEHRKGRYCHNLQQKYTKIYIFFIVLMLKKNNILFVNKTTHLQFYFIVKTSNSVGNETVISLANNL